MGLVDRYLGKAITKAIGENPAAWSMIIGSWPRKWQRSGELFTTPTVQDMEEAYKHPIIRACITEIAGSLSEPEIEVGIWENGQWVDQGHHAILDLLADPNPETARADLIQQWTTRMELTGTGYIWKVRSRTGQVVNLLSIPTSWIRPVKSDRGIRALSHYEVTATNKPVPLEDFCVAKHVDPGDVSGGVSPYESVHHDNALDKEREKYLAEMLINLKVPGLTVIVKDGFKSDPKRKQAKREIEKSVGTGMRGSTLLLEGDVDTKLENPLGDLDWPGFSGSIESRICMAYGVPPIIIGSRFGLERSTYANYTEARRSFYQETLRPKWVHLAAALTRSLFREEGEDKLVLRFRFDSLPEFQEDQLAKAQRVTMLYNAGIIPLPTAQEELGYNPEELAKLEYRPDDIPVVPDEEDSGDDDMETDSTPEEEPEEDDVVNQ